MKSRKNFKQMVEEEHSSWVDTLLGKSVKEMEDHLVTLAKHRQEIIEDRNNRDDIKQLQEELKELKAPFRDALKANDAKQKYLVELIKEKGGK
jgi:hypothetical protein